MKSFTSLFMMALVCVLMLASVSTLRAQGFTLHLTVSDGDKDTVLVLGEDPTATFGTDGSLGEVEAPVAPPDSANGGGAFDVRFIAPTPDTAGTGWGVGRTVDYRQYVSFDQSDTFLIQFQSALAADGGGAMQFSWSPVELGGFRWRFLNSLDQTELGTMSSPPFVIPGSYYAGSNPSTVHSVYLVKSLASQYRSFSYEQMSNTFAIDDKGKWGKEVQKNSDKAKPWKVYFSTTFVNPLTNSSSLGIDELYLKCGVAIDPATFVVTSSNNAYTLSKTSPDGKNKNWFIKTSAGTFAPGDTFRISGVGLAGKAQKMDCYTYSSATGKAVPKGNKTPQTVASTLLMHMPNVVNLMDWLYTNGTFPLDSKSKSLGVVDGSTDNIKNVLAAKAKDTFRYVYHPKYGDALKTLSKGGTQFHVGSPSYLNQAAGKFIVKPQKSLGPDKEDNLLLAEALTLKLNILFSNYGLTPAGFGNLKVIGEPNGSFAYFEDSTFAQISNNADAYLTFGAGGSPAHSFAYSANDLYTVLNTINNAFTGAFDTASWASSTPAWKPIVPGAAYIPSWVGLGSKMPAEVLPRYVDYAVVPTEYQLQQNYPNPFNPSTMINFTLPEDAVVTITVFNVLGQQVATLANNELYTAGMNHVQFNANNLASGVYFYRILVGDPESGEMMFSQVNKMMLLK